MAIHSQRRFQLVLISFIYLLCLASSQNCGANCWKCDSVEICTNCDVGFYLTQNYTCQPCQLGCIQCYSNQLCTQCISNYILNSSTNTCSKCPQNCVSCEYNVNAVRCLDCGVGSYLSNYNKQCEPCKQFCSQCTNSNDCKLCAIGFGLNEDDQRCQLCSSNCLYCSQISNESSIMGCIRCEPGYYIDSNNTNTCIQCMENCQTCGNGTWCGICNQNYYPSKIQNPDQSEPFSTNKCEQCPDQYCLRCSESNPEQCNSCLPGYYYDQQNFKCVWCTQNCEYCLSSTQCKSCLPGYYMKDQKSCQICGTACTSCISSNNCTQCSGSYYLAEGQCEVCNYGCAKCSAYHQCETCISYQFALYEAECQICSTYMWKCLSCLNSTFCIECDSNYYLYNGNCITNNNGMSTWGIILIILSIAVVIGALIFAVIKKREANAAQGERAYMEIP